MMPSGTKAEAESFTLELPVDCVIGESCWLVNLADVDPTETAEDFRCLGRTYNGHKGTDFSIENKAAIARNVIVRAAASGRVKGTRDGMHDTGFDNQNPQADIAGRECGNGLVIDHGEGWVTQYCHMRKNSLQVKPGERVKVGQPLGAIGQSGLAEFPHLHLSVRKDDIHIDPFTGQSLGAGCDGEVRPIWSETALSQLPDQISAIYHMGFADREPQIDDIRTGRYGALVIPSDAPALVAFAEIYWVEPGDDLHFVILGPNGQVFSETNITLDRRQARRTQMIGRKLGQRRTAWPSGPYRAILTLDRAAGVSGAQSLRLERRATIIVE